MALGCGGALAAMLTNHGGRRGKARAVVPRRVGQSRRDSLMGTAREDSCPRSSNAVGM